MSGLFPSQGPSAFDAIASLAAAILYLAVGLAAILYAPRDSRARVFFVTAVTSVAPYTATTYAWMWGGTAALARPVVAAVALSLVIGSLALLHLMQIFPWRRPWIRSHVLWLTAGYLILPIVAAVVVWKGPGLEELASPDASVAFA
ncbi:MAG: hypothetical protein ACRD1V_20825, partial [Vicinamibacterales bacterium]